MHDTTATTTETDQPTCPSHKRRPGEPVWCPDCRDDLATMVWRLPGQRDRLLAAADGQATRGAVGRAGTRVDPPSPSPEFDQADEMDTVLSEWASAWLDHLGSTEVRGRTTGWAARVLGDTRRGDVWAWHQAADLGRAVRILAGGARRLLGGSVDTVDLMPLQAPCPGCHLITLVREDGGDRITCTRCPRVVPVKEYEGIVARLLGTAGVAA
ncbi:hypothetical protein [Embleya sp. NPDC005971]|uniref:hypothetical protein n=1 Tax=Embleya sp. NPDC005971 TaxID=3156724 RepID=UPI0033C5EC6B